MRSFLWLACRQVGFWCWCSWFYAKIGRWKEHGHHYSTRWSFLEIACLIRDLCRSVVPFYRGSDLYFQGLRQSDPIHRERESRPISIQCPKRWFRILLTVRNCSLFLTHPTLLEQMCDFQKTHNVLPEVDLSPQDLPHNRRVETIPVYIVFAILPT